jgi:hypothetical protein
MPKFRKKPVVIEAMLYPGFREIHEASRVFLWLDEHEAEYNHNSGWLTITTLEGSMRVSPGDWIIKGVKGEFYPCKPDIFEATYEIVQDDEEILQEFGF